MPGQVSGISKKDAIALVRRLQEAVNAHDTSKLIELYTEDAVVLSLVFHEVCGRPAIAAAWDVMFSTYPDWKVSVSDVLVDGNRIIALGTNVGTDRMGWFGLPPTGEMISYSAVLLLTLAGTRIIRDERLYDSTVVLEHLEKVRADRELRTAAEVQTALLPRTARSGVTTRPLAIRSLVALLVETFSSSSNCHPATSASLLGTWPAKGRLPHCSPRCCKECLPSRHELRKVHR